MDQIEAVVAQNKYGAYSVPANLEHGPAIKRITNGQVYEPKTIAFMARNAGQGDIVHAGTYFGDFLPGVSAGLAKDCKIWAFEPNPNSYRNAAETIRLNKLDTVELRNNALSAQNGEILFKTHDDSGRPMGGHSHFVEQPGQGVTNVDAVILDDVIPADRKVSILQLDVGGHERAALLGARRIIETWQPILILDGFQGQRWLRHTFEGLEYKRVRKLHGNTVFVTPETIIQPLHDG
jgi:FkbM family methyltransferase